jgi:hypothetical protein
VSQKNKHPFIFPHNFKIAGIVILIPALLFTFLRFHLGIKPGFLKQKVFAFYSSFLETKYFSFIENNISEEICAVLLLVSLVFIAFSYEKNELDEFWNIRFKDLFTALYINIIFILISIIFIFGLAFMKILILNIYSTLIIYTFLTQYHFKKFRENQINNFSKNIFEN